MYSWLIPIVVAMSAGAWNAGSTIPGNVQVAFAILAIVTLAFAWSLIVDFRRAETTSTLSLDNAPVSPRSRQSSR